MAQHHIDVAFEEQLKVIGKFDKKYSKKAIEDFFGIAIKEVDSEKNLYNLYKDNKLIYAKVHSFVLESIFKAIISRFIGRMCEEAEKDDNIEETERIVAERGAEGMSNSAANHYTCPYCGKYAKKGTHFHT